MDTLLSSLEILARWDVILALVVGSVGGVLIGAIPGVGPAVAIAILLPATFSMDPIVGLTVLLGIYGSSMYGGAIPAVLINTPGTAVNALTTYDGFPMTARGEPPEQRLPPDGVEMRGNFVEQQNRGTPHLPRDQIGMGEHDAEQQRLLFAGRA